MHVAAVGALWAIWGVALVTAALYVTAIGQNINEGRKHPPPYDNDELRWLVTGFAVSCAIVIVADVVHLWV